MFRRLRAWSAHRTPVHIPPNAQVHRVRFIKSPLSKRTRGVSALLYGTSLVFSGGIALYGALLYTPGHKIYIPLGFKEKSRAPRRTPEELEVMRGYNSNKALQDRWTNALEKQIHKLVLQARNTAKLGPWELYDSTISYYYLNSYPPIYTQKSLIISLGPPDAETEASDPDPPGTVTLFIAIGDRVMTHQQVANSTHYTPITFLKVVYSVFKDIYRDETDPPPNQPPFSERLGLTLEDPVKSAGTVLKVLRAQIQHRMKREKMIKYRRNDLRPDDVAAHGVVLLRSRNQGYLSVMFKCSFPPNDPQKAIFEPFVATTIFTPAGLPMPQWEKNWKALQEKKRTFELEPPRLEDAAEALRIYERERKKKEAERQLWMKEKALEQERKNEEIRRAQSLNPPPVPSTEEKERQTTSEDEKPDIRERDQQNKAADPKSETKDRSSSETPPPPPPSGPSSPNP